MIALALLACAGAPAPVQPADSPAPALDSGASGVSFSIRPEGGAGELAVVGGTLSLEQAWVLVWSVALRPCEAAQARPLLSWLLPVAWAGHDIDDPGATAQPTWVDLLSAQDWALGDAQVVSAPCAVNLLVGGAASQEAPLPELEGLSVYARGELRPESGEPSPVEIRATLAYDQDRDIPLGVLDAGGQVSFGLSLPELLADLDPLGEHPDRELLRRIVEGYTVEVAP